MCRLISSGIVLTKQVSVKSEVSSKTKRVCVCVFFFFFHAHVKHMSVISEVLTVEVTSEPWRACTAREAF